MEKYNYDETDAGKPPVSNKKKRSEVMSVLSCLAVGVNIAVDLWMGNPSNAALILLVFLLGITVGANSR